MHCLPRVLVWVRGVLFGARTPGRRSRADAVPSTPDQPPQHCPPSPEAGGACRHLVRARHAAWARATEPRARLGDLRTLVPLYVLSPAEREQALSVPAGAAREVLR